MCANVLSGREARSSSTSCAISKREGATKQRLRSSPRAAMWRKSCELSTVPRKLAPSERVSSMTPSPRRSTRAKRTSICAAYRRFSSAVMRPSPSMSGLRALKSTTAWPPWSAALRPIPPSEKRSYRPSRTSAVARRLARAASALKPRPSTPSLPVSGPMGCPLRNCATSNCRTSICAE